jgi:hypothetical protein
MQAEAVIQFLSVVTVIFFETTRLLFRSHQAQDKEEFIQMHTDPKVRRYVGGQAWSLEHATDSAASIWGNPRGRMACGQRF